MENLYQTDPKQIEAKKIAAQKKAALDAEIEAESELIALELEQHNESAAQALQHQQLLSEAVIEDAGAKAEHRAIVEIEECDNDSNKIGEEDEVHPSVKVAHFLSTVQPHPISAVQQQGISVISNQQLQAQLQQQQQQCSSSPVSTSQARIPTASQSTPKHSQQGQFLDADDPSDPSFPSFNPITPRPTSSRNTEPDMTQFIPRMKNLLTTQPPNSQITQSITLPTSVTPSLLPGFPLEPLSPNTYLLI